MNTFFKFCLKNTISRIWKTLIVVVLSILLIAPSSALALVDYNSTLQSYISSVKLQLDSIVGSIKELPQLSYENGQKVLTKIDGNLQEIQNGVGENIKDFKGLSNKAQTDYEQYLNLSKNISKIGYPESVTEVLSSLLNINTNYEIRGISDRKPTYISYLESIYGNEQLKYFFASLINNPKYQEQVASLYKVCHHNLAIKRNPKYREYIKDDLLYTCLPLEDAYTISQLPNLIVLSTKISKIYDDIEKRITLARQKFGNIKEYSLMLNSFSDPDVLGEISELDIFIANLTKNLPNAS